MNVVSLQHINNVNTIFHPAFAKGIELGYIIYHTNKETINIITKDDFKLINQFTGDYGSYHIIENNLILRSNNKLIEIDIKTGELQNFCKTREERINLINFRYSFGLTSQRKPRLKRGEIIRNNDNEVIYKWTDKKGVLTFVNDYPLFQTRDNHLILFDIQKEKDIWNVKLDNGSFGQRIIAQTDGVFYLQRAVSKPNLFNVLALEKSTGEIIWETENTHPYYCFDEVNNKLYGLGNKRFEVINTLTGKKELVTELDINIFISSHLIYYNDGLLYFSSHLDKNIPVFGGINVKTGILEFVQEVKIEGEKSFRIGLEKPIVVDNRLYIKDSLNTLHIFEKEHGSANDKMTPIINDSTEKDLHKNLKMRKSLANQYIFFNQENQAGTASVGEKIKAPNPIGWVSKQLISFKYNDISVKVDLTEKEGVVNLNTKSFTKETLYDFANLYQLEIEENNDYTFLKTKEIRLLKKKEVLCGNKKLMILFYYNHGDGRKQPELYIHGIYAMND